MRAAPPEARLHPPARRASFGPLPPVLLWPAVAEDETSELRPDGGRQRPAPARPEFRSLTDFGELTPGESALLDACRTGTKATLAGRRPARESPGTRVRARFIRFLCLGGDDAAAVDLLGIWLSGAWVVEDLDLRGATEARPLLLESCRLEGVLASDGHIKRLVLIDCLLEGPLHAQQLRCDGDFYFADGSSVTGEVGLAGASIEGDLSLAGARLDNPAGVSLNLQGARIRGGLFLNAGFSSAGSIFMHGASIGTAIACTAGRFAKPKDIALALDRTKVTGSVFINNGAEVEGEVRIIACDIEGSLDLVGGTFRNPGANALICDTTRARGGFFFRGATRVEGQIDLNSSQLGDLCDDAAVWENSSGPLLLDGFVYDHITGGAPVDAEFRIAWLKRQRSDHLLESFRPQPWEQLIKVLRASGNPDEARKVAIAKHRQMRDAGRYAGGSKLWDSIYGGLIGYGYEPWRLFRVVVALWAACTLAYWAAVNPQWFGATTHLLAPSRAEASLACVATRLRHRDDPCLAPRRQYADFFAPAFSAEVLLPVVTLGYKGEWKPVVSAPDGSWLLWGWAIRIVYWVEIAFGWLAGLLLVSAVGNLMKRE